MTRLVIRELRGHSDFVAAQRLAQEVWGFQDLQVPSTFDLQVVGHVGGLTAGAFRGSELAGFVHGLPRTDLGKPCHHSHLLAVRPEFRGRGLAVRLKFFQRRWCLERGIRRMTWTYDPLLVANARLNLVRLRARARVFLPNVYGELGGLYGALPTDRFEVLWSLGAKRSSGQRAESLRSPATRAGSRVPPRATCPARIDSPWRSRPAPPSSMRRIPRRPVRPDDGSASSRRLFSAAGTRPFPWSPFPKRPSMSSRASLQYLMQQTGIDARRSAGSCRILLGQCSY